MIINSNTAAKLFFDLKQHLRETSTLEVVERLYPSAPETLEWRYELRGVLNALAATNQISHTPHEDAIEILFGKPPANQERPGRKYQFSIDVTARTPRGEEHCHDFNVAAMNALDAYVQLTKRMTYRCIIGIERVAVFDNPVEDRRPEQRPIRTFSQDDLIFVEQSAASEKEVAA